MTRQVTVWTSSGKTFKVGDFVCLLPTHPTSMKGVITSIDVCDAGDGHVILDNNPSTLTDFFYIDFDKSHYREEKLKSIGI